MDLEFLEREFKKNPKREKLQYKNFIWPNEELNCGVPKGDGIIMENVQTFLSFNC